MQGKKLAIKLEDMHPVPVIFLSLAVPLNILYTFSPSLTKSVIPEATTVQFNFLATAFTISDASEPSSNESTPFPATSSPPINLISDMFPRTTVKFTSFNNLLVSSPLALLAKTPTGSSTTGLL